MIHLDTSNKASLIAPLCGHYHQDDSFIFVDVENRRDLKASVEYADCLQCKNLALENSKIRTEPDTGKPTQMMDETAGPRGPEPQKAG